MNEKYKVFDKNGVIDFLKDLIESIQKHEDSVQLARFITRENFEITTIFKRYYAGK